MRRLCQVIKYGFRQSKVLSKQQKGITKNRWMILFDMLYCFFKYRMWTNQYINEKFYDKDKSEREIIGVKYLKDGQQRDAWYKDYLANKKFIRKYSNLKYDIPPLRKIRNLAYQKRYNMGKGAIVDYSAEFSRVHYLPGTIKIGDRCLFAKRVFIDYSGFVEIGNDVHFSDGAMLWSHEHSVHETLISNNDESSATPCKIIIEDGVNVGARAMIMNSCHKVGRYSMISAGAVVHQKVPPYSIVMGNPAKIIGFMAGIDEIIAFEKKKYQEKDRLSRDILEKNEMKYFPSSAEFKKFINQTI